jgi:hypothetical protein
MTAPKSTASAYRSRDGVQIAPAPERFELLMRHRSGRDARAVSPSFEALLDLREQLLRLGYALVRLERQS